MGSMPDIENKKQIRERPGREHYRLLVTALSVLWFVLAVALWAYWGKFASRVEVTWETATEQKTAGFALYRREGERGEFVPVSENHFVESRGGPTSGATYSYLDERVEAGKTYFYLLEEIELDGSRRRFDDDLLEFQVVDSIWQRTAVIAFCCFLGAVMLLAGKNL
jgi:hypothetical protein